MSGKNSEQRVHDGELIYGVIAPVLFPTAYDYDFGIRQWQSSPRDRFPTCDRPQLRKPALQQSLLQGFDCSIA